MSANSTLSNEIAIELRTQILTGALHQGDRLPSERDLSARFQASRGAVREALSQLEQLGLINIQLGGARVRALNEARIAVLGPLMEASATPQPRLIDQFLQTFGALAVLTAEEAVANADHDELIRMQEIVVSLDSKAGDFVAQQECWRDFFQTLTEVANNLVVQLIGNDLKAQFVDSVTKLGIQPTFRKQVMNKILTGLKQGLETRDKGKTAAAVSLYFEELGLSMHQALTEQKQAS